MKKYSRIFVNSDLSLEEIAVRLKKILNAKDTNVYAKGPQLRYGDNYGGEYYLIECIGLEIIIIENTDDALVEDHEAFKFYLLIQFIENHELSMNPIAKQIEFLLKKDKLRILLDENF